MPKFQNTKTGAPIAFGTPAFILRFFHARLKAVRKKKRITATTVPRERVVATYSASSPKSAKRGMMKGAGRIYWRISAMRRDLS